MTERKENGYPSDKPIDEWTRQECEAYLAQYPKSLRSEAVRKRYEVFRPLIDAEIQAEKKSEEERRKREEERRRREELRRKEEMEGKKREEEWKKVETGRRKKNWISVKKVIKYTCIVACVGLGIAAIITAITTDAKLTLGGLVPLFFAIKQLSEWNVEE